MKTHTYNLNAAMVKWEAREARKLKDLLVVCTAVKSKETMHKRSERLTSELYTQATACALSHTQTEEYHNLNKGK